MSKKIKLSPFRPLLFLRRILFDKVLDINETPRLYGRLYCLRLLFGLGFMIIWLNIVASFDNPPSLDNANIYKGKLLEVSTEKGSRRGQEAISLKMKNGEEVRFEGAFYPPDILPILQQQVHKPITVWSYARRNIVFLEEHIFIELEVDGRKLKNNWPEVKKRIESSNPKLWILIGLIISLISIYFIFIIFKQNNVSFSREDKDIS